MSRLLRWATAFLKLNIDSVFTRVDGTGTFNAKKRITITFVSETSNSQQERRNSRAARAGMHACAGLGPTTA